MLKAKTVCPEGRRTDPGKASQLHATAGRARFAWSELLVWHRQSNMEQPQPLKIAVERGGMWAKGRGGGAKAYLTVQKTKTYLTLSKYSSILF